MKNPSKDLVIRDLTTDAQKSFSGVMRYAFSKDNGTLLLQTEAKTGESTMQALSWMDFPDGKPATIWQGAQTADFVLDEDGKQLAFTVLEKVNNESVSSFWYYRRGAEKATLLADRRTPGVDAGMKLESVQRFSKDGNSLFCTLTESKDPPKPNPDAAKVDVWSYTDIKLQSQQLSEPPRMTSSYMAILHIQDRAMVRLQQHEDEEIRFSQRQGNKFALAVHRRGDHHEDYWSRAAQPVYHLVSIRNGERRRIDLPGAGDARLTHFSPDEKYVITLHQATGDYLSYEIETGMLRNFTKAIPVPSNEEYDPAWPFVGPRGFGRAGGCLENDEACLIQDKYDIWLVDPAGKTLPVSVTNGYGRGNHIQFRLAGGDHGNIAKGQKLILAAFNTKTKDSGFYSKVLGKEGDPDLLTPMGPYTYQLGAKAKDAEVYLAQRQSAAESPNYFLTGDFKSFTPLSNIFPEKDYNWLRSELVTWTTFDDKPAQGALYKPGNFDPKKQYPIIFHYYERKSDNLNHYERPSPMDGGFPISLFVSNGYLVFTPDIYYAMGEPGPSAYNYVVSAAKHMATFPWVDSKKMGIMGHSFGGYETNYLVANTDIFAAAMSSSGFSNMVSYYGDIMDMGIAFNQSWAEKGGGRLLATPWQRPDLYVKNSPIFRADKVTAPLLMMNNKKDGIVDFAQGVEFFTALRRLGKKAWMLQYDDEGHGLRPFANKAIAVKDLTMRVMQFFDHYLKGAPAPKWMIEGIPARLKGIETGFDLDLSGRVPGPGLLISDKGIKFEEGLNWEQVREKAKAENKHIFVDAYATWCGPCKVMDNHVYITEKVGSFFNDKFVSVKIQFDQTEKDSEEVKSWYTTAEAMQKQYRIGGFPTYLFFSPDGEIVHRGGGLKKIDDFIALASESLDPSRQYYTLLENFRKGKIPATDLLTLAMKAAQFGEQDVANAIAKNHKETLSKLSIEELLTKDNIQFVSQFAGEFLLPEGSKGKFFNLFYKYPDRVDALLERKGHSRTIVDWIVNKEEIDEKLWVDGKPQDSRPITKNPDWKSIRAAISKEYGDSYAERLVPPARLNFYKRIKDWPKYAEVMDEKIRKSPPTTEEKGLATDSWVLNVAAWDIFEGSSDKKILEKALRWIDLSIKLDLEGDAARKAATKEKPMVNEQILDTKANLLYKMGRVREAIALEEKAIALLKERKVENHPVFADLSRMLDKMKKGEPTWPVK